jgi:FkbM family methyltransferase
VKKIKSILINVLGREQYLRLLSKVFLFSFRRGWLRNQPAYRTHYFVRHLIQPGQTVIDIGANLGYYSTEFARLTGPAGRVLAVEPIPLYRRILQQNIQSLAQVQVLPYALGEEEGTISMGLPFADQHRHGLMKVLTQEEKQKAPEIFEVELKHPLHLFSHLNEIHYIKCDIEGYEVPVIPAMKALIEQKQPIMQVETDGQNKRTLHAMFNEMHYQMFYVGNQGLVPYPDASLPLPGDLIAIPSSKTGQFASLIQSR